MRLFNITIFFIIFLFLVPAAEPAEESPKELIYKISNLIKNERLDEAMRLNDTFIELYPEVAAGYNVRGNIYIKSYKPEQAIESYRKALELTHLAHNRSIILSNIGSCYVLINKFEEALRYFELSMQAYQDSSTENSLNKAMLLILLGQVEKAENLYDELLPQVETADKILTSANQANAGIMYMKFSEVAFQLKRKSDVLKLLRKALRLAKNDDYRALYAHHLAALGDKENAESNFSMVNPENVRPVLVASYYTAMEDYEKAREYFIKSYEEQKTPEQLQTWRNEIKRDGMYPIDVWKDIRDKDWFKSRVEGAR